MPDRWAEVGRILDLALDLAPEERPAFLDRACAGDGQLRATVESMLAGADAQVFFESPAIAFAAPLVEAEAAARDGAIVGPYRLVRELGHGGMGVVYLAERADGQFEQRVALKLIKRGMDSEEILRRFLAERQVLARLSHAHIARLLDGGVTAEGQPYFAMEYVEGVPLNRYCEERRLGVEECLGLFRNVCEAVQYAHRNLVVHRDLKPSNILVTPSGEIKLLDFGIAKALSQEPAEPAVTRAEQRLMTPEYAAPEQLRGEPVTTATDVYALGAILYELLTGRPAHRLAGRTAAERERVICEVDPEAPSAVVAATPRNRLRWRLAGDLDTIVLKALRKEPASRYPSVEELLDRGAMRIDSGLARQPELQAELLDVLGVIHRDLGLYPEADGLLQRAVRRSRARYGEAHPEVAVRLTHWAGVLAARGEYVRAESLLASAYAILRARGPEDSIVAGTLRARASVQRQLGHFARAESLYREALRIDRIPRQRDQLRVAEDLDNLAMVSAEAGNLARADSGYREALERRRRVYPDEHPEVAYALQSLANTLQIQGGYAKAESLNLEALAILRQRLGADHPETLELVRNLATLEYEAGDLRGAETAFREVHAAWGRSLGTDHPTTLGALNDLAAVLKYQRRYAEAEPLYREALALRRQRLGDSHPDVGESWGNLAEMLHDAGELAEAERAYDQTLAIYRAALPAGHVFISGSLIGLGSVLTDRGRASEAEPLLREALKLRLEKLGPADRRTAKAQRALGLCLGALGRRPEAEGLLLQSYRTLAPAKNWYHRTLGEQTLRDLVALYDGWGKRAEAARLRALLEGGVQRVR